MSATDSHITPPPNYKDNEITLKELVEKIQEYGVEVKRNWILIVAGILVIGTIFFVKEFLKPTTYKATLTFMVNEDEGGRSGGAISGLLGQFGFSTGVSGSYNLPKILELSRSRRIVQEALTEKVKVKDQSDYLANHIIKTYHYHDKWKGNNALVGFLFKQDSVELFDEVENKVLKILYGHVVGDPDNDVEGLMSVSYGEETSILSVTTKSESEELSLQLADVLYDKLSEFYVDKATEKQEVTYRLIKMKKDSLLSVLNNKQYQLLKFNDTYRNLALQQFGSKQYELQRDIQMLTLAYAEAAKNLEMADFSLKNSTPFFQVIDWPIPPLKSSFSLVGLIKELLIGAFLGVFLSIGFIVGRKMLKETLS